MQKHNFFLPILFCLVMVGTSVLALCTEDDALWQQAVDHRKAGHYKQAYGLFLPFAEHPERDLRALHNLGFCAFELGNEGEAYTWYKKASDRDFKPSHRNLERMNLWDLLIPAELQVCVASFLPLPDFASFSVMSKTSRDFFKREILRTNFLNPSAQFAHDFFQACLKDVVFSSPPKGISLKNAVSAQTGAIQVHFRDGEHLREIVETTPYIIPGQCSFCYFVRNPNVKDDGVFIAEDKNLKRTFVTQIDTPHSPQLTGTIALPFPLCLPRNSDISQLNGGLKGGMIQGTSPAYRKGLFLANMLGKFDDKYLKHRDDEVRALFEKQKERRHLYPENFLGFENLCPGVFEGEFKYVQRDRLSVGGEGLITCIAKSLSALDLMAGAYPMHNRQRVLYLDPSCDQPGVYYKGPLRVEKGFHIYTYGKLAFAGTIDLPEHYLEIVAYTLWGVGFKIKAKDLELNVKNLALYAEASYSPFRFKPDTLPTLCWMALRNQQKSADGEHLPWFAES